MKCTLYVPRQVVNGPTIPIAVLGSGVEPKLVFTPREVDFGMCFLQQAEMSAKRATVVITNRESDEMRLVISPCYTLYGNVYTILKAYIL